MRENSLLNRFGIVLTLIWAVHAPARAGEPVAGSGPDALTVYFLANEGVLISGGGHRAVVDFPYFLNEDWCQTPKEEQIQALVTAKTPFERIDVFLFTHDHVDHFDPELVRRTLVSHPDAAVIGTAKVLKRLREQAEGTLKNPMFLAEAGNSIEFGAVRIDVLKAPLARYWDIDPVTGEKKTYDDGYVHVAYRVQLGGRSFVHGGDATDIAFTEGMKADLLLLDRGMLKALGMDALKALHDRLGASRTALMHISPRQTELIGKLIVGQESWLSALTEADRQAIHCE